MAEPPEPIPVVHYDQPANPWREPVARGRTAAEVKGDAKRARKAAARLARGGR